MLSVLLFLYLPLQSQNIKPLKIYSFEEVEQLQKKNQKPLLVFIYTDWCKICYGMKKTSFKNKDVIKLLNKDFYFISFDGEYKNDINFLGKKFKNIKSGNTGTHEMTLELGKINNKITYPIIVIMNSKYQIDYSINNYLKAEEIHSILKEYLKDN